MPAVQPDQLDSLLQSSLTNIIHDYQSSTSPKELSQLIENIDLQTSKLDSAIHNYVALKRKSHEKNLSNLEFKRATRLASTITASSNLSDIFQVADSLGHALTIKIKSLDDEIANVNSTLQYVKHIHDLKSGLSRAHYALDHGQLDVAANCIASIRSNVPRALIDGHFASAVIPSTDLPELPGVVLENWTGQLTSTFTEKFNEAAKARDVEHLTKYFQLFPLIGQHEVGLACYSRFICDIIADTAKSLLSKVSSESTPGVFATVAVSLFESISVMISQHEPLIKRYYAKTHPEAMQSIITRIQSEIDSQIGVISDTLYDVRRLDKLNQDIKLHSFPLLSHNNEEGAELPADEDVVSILQVGDVVNELAVLFHHWSLYCHFVSARYLQDTPRINTSTNTTRTNTSNNTPTSTSNNTPTSTSNGNSSTSTSVGSSTSTSTGLSIPSVISNSNFTRKISVKLLPKFEALYVFYFRRSLEKALAIEEVPSLEPFLVEGVSAPEPHLICSSVIEDITLVLNTTLRNVLQTSMVSTVKKFVGETTQILQNDLVNGFYIRNLNHNQPRYNQALTFTAESHSGASTNGNITPATRSNTPEVGMSFFKGASTALGNVVGGTATGTQPSLASTLRTGPNPPRLLAFIVYLNTISLGHEYFAKIVSNIVKTPNFIASSFPYNSDAEKVEHWLNNDLLGPFVAMGNKIINDSLINLYNQSSKTRLITLINDLVPELPDTYLVQDDIDEASSSDSRLVRFSLAWSALIKPYNQTMHSPLFQKFLRLLILNLINLLEKRLHFVLKKFGINDLGSIRLEKDISFLINAICEDNYQLREKFVRITQMVLLVDMDDDEYQESLAHVNQAQGDEVETDEYHLGINWVLTPQERKQVRSYKK